jgi:hypothetical protein
VEKKQQEDAPEGHHGKVASLRLARIARRREPQLSDEELRRIRSLLERSELVNAHCPLAQRILSGRK